MKTLSTLKTLPLIGLLAMGLALAPAVSMADDDDRGRGKDRVYQKYDGGKGHHHRNAGKSHHRDKGHKHVNNHYTGHGHKHHGHTHKVYRPHSHGHGHRHTDYVVVHDRHYDYDPFRLMLGLHFDNIDIIYRDF